MDIPINLTSPDELDGIYSGNNGKSFFSSGFIESLFDPQGVAKRIRDEAGPRPKIKRLRRPWLKKVKKAAKLENSISLGEFMLRACAPEPLSLYDFIMKKA